MEIDEHEKEVRETLSALSERGVLKSRESTTIEFKESYNGGSLSKYAKTMAAFANHCGGYIIFGVKDKPRTIVGLKNDSFENLKQEELSEFLNVLFAPAIDWCCGTFTLNPPSLDNPDTTSTAKIGWIYTYEASSKPIIAQKSKDKIVDGDVFYRYRARSEKIKCAEMHRIIGDKVAKEREGLLKLFEAIRKGGAANLGIVNYSNGRITTPYGVDFAVERKLVAQILRKAKCIKEGSFNETNGTPVLKITGSIDLAEEVPVPEGNPDVTHPYIQKQLAEKLNIKNYDLYALIAFYHMKGNRKFHLEISTSKSGKVHKFSDYALQFLRKKLNELQNRPEEFDRIRKLYKEQCNKKRSS